MKDTVFERRQYSSIYYISEFLIILFLFLTAYVRVMNNNGVALALCTGTMMAAGFLNLGIAAYRGEYSMILFAIAACLLWGIEYFFRTSWCYEAKFLLCSVAFIGIAYNFIVEYKNTALYAILYYVIAAYILIELVIFRIPIRAFMKDKTTYNYISVVLLFYLLLLNYIQWKNKQEFLYLPAIVFAVVAVVSYGRGGIVTAVIYCVFLLWIKARLHRGSRRKYIVAAVFIILLALFGGTLYSYLLSSGSLAKFTSMGFDSNGRTEIWSTFLNSCFSSVSNFILGGYPIVDGILGGTEGNLHNSFLQLYASFGIFFFGICLILYIRSLKSTITTKDLPFFLITLTFSVRAFTDKLMYRGYFEIIFYLILFTPLITPQTGGKKQYGA